MEKKISKWSILWLIEVILIGITLLTIVNDQSCKAQPIQPRPVQYLFEGYHPTKCDPCFIDTKSVTSHKGVITYKQNVIHKDTVYKSVNTDKVFVIENYHSFVMPVVQNKEVNKPYDKYASVILHNEYKTSGTIKIISGLTLQGFAIGLIALANNKSYDIKDIEETHVLEYIYPVYQLSTSTAKCLPVPKPPHNNGNKETDNTNTNTNTNSSTSSATSTSSSNSTNTNNNTNTINLNVPVTVNNNININIPTYTLSQTDKIGTIIFKDKHQIVTEHKKDKTGYYISAATLGVIGGILEVWGICDIHKARFYLTSNTIGLNLTF